jgi:tRNA(fMet)-specific endonuclease VapC
LRYFVDTNIWIFCLQGRSREAWDRILAQPPESIALALQTYAELLLGVAKCSRPAEGMVKLKKLITPYAIVLPTLATAERYAQIRADLERKGATISEQDLWIAAVALEESGTVVTNNVWEFSRIQGLAVEDWTRPLSQ